MMCTGSDGNCYTSFGFLTDNGDFMPIENYKHYDGLLTLVDDIRSWAAEHDIAVNKVHAYRLANKILNNLG